MGEQIWRDALLLRNITDPLNLPPHCDGCNTALSIFHVLDYKNDGLIANFHNKIYDGVVDLAGKYFSRSHMSNVTLIHPVRTVQ